MYLTYIGFYAKINPEAAPKIQDDQIDSVSKGELFQLVLRGFLPPVALIFMVKGSILFGFATPSEAGAVGAFGAFMLAVAKGRMSWEKLKGICEASGLTISMIFMIIIAATCFAYVFRSLGGDYIVEDLIAEAGLGS